MEDPNRTIKLFCWIRGVDDSLFPVNISQSQTVGDLKEAIKNENDNVLSNVPACQVKLWKVSGFLILPKPCCSLILFKVCRIQASIQLTADSSLAAQRDSVHHTFPGSFQSYPR
jgi:hypothetical protein